MSWKHWKQLAWQGSACPLRFQPPVTRRSFNLREENSNLRRLHDACPFAAAAARLYCPAAIFASSTILDRSFPLMTSSSSTLWHRLGSHPTGTFLSSDSGDTIKEF